MPASRKGECVPSFLDVETFGGDGVTGGGVGDDDGETVTTGLDVGICTSSGADG